MKVLLRLDKIKSILGLSLFLTFLVATGTEVLSQTQGVFVRPMIPKLSLTGEEESYDKAFYPDGRIWVPPTVSGAREFLVPVFVTNNWFSYKNAEGVANYKVEPIKSFKFSVFYNDKAVRAIGVETIHPSYVPADRDPLAHSFTIKTDDVEDDYYWYFINPNKWSDTKDKEDGRRIVISGTSLKELPETDPMGETYEVLLYVRFRVMAKKEGGSSGFNLIQTTPIYIDNREVKYNELDVAKQFAWEGMVDYDTAGQNYYNLYNRARIGNNRGRLDGNLFLPETYLSGMTNAIVSEDENAPILPGPLVDDAMFKIEPVYPGAITLKITDNVPKFRVTSIANDELPKNDDESVYEIPDLVSVDDNSPEQYGIARIKLVNSTSKSRLQQVSIETDSEWLRINKDALNENKGFSITNNGRNGFINWIDNGILGESLDPVMKTTVDDGDVLVEVRCDPTKLPKVAGEIPHGLHIGYITLRSSYAEVNPVRIKVTFLFIRNPYEPDWTKSIGNPGGINLLLNNRIGQTAKLVFGTGDRATESVDNLYGEFAYNSPLSTTVLDARFYPTNPNVAPMVPFGFGDFAPSIIAPRTNSRDIRPYTLPKGVNSWVYKAKVSNLEANYPITVSWDVREFPLNAQLYIKPVINGVAGQATNMYEATKVNEFVRSYTITDTRVNEFLIEYTLPQSVNFVDDLGNPLIKKGWNLLSLPLNPENTFWKNVYKNAINEPWAFVNSQYQQRQNLKFGEGYFIKYPELVDTKFAGAFIRTINADNAIKVFAGDTPDPGNASVSGGWNLVGALSVLTAVEGITYSPSDDGALPAPEYTLQYGVYGYRTDLGYYQVSNMTPGMGYWIKSSNDGYYNLEETYVPKLSNVAFQNEKTTVLNNSQVINIRDNGQKENNLYITNLNGNVLNYFELPPVPMAGMFDVRFSDNKSVSNNNESVVKLQGVTYPLAVNINNADANYTLTDAVTGEYLGSISKGESSSITIEGLSYNSLRIAKTEVMTGADNSLTANPNPASEFSNINFSINEASNVTVSIFDALGNVVETIVNAQLNAGTYNYNVNLANYSNGNYFVKIIAGQYNSVVKINVVK
ncbi:MAG TPA: T9SS type A sorting domain-containing protein [Candidatus Kapabacteria bacterium]|nr:T9SS type A sorting domain-containing protein [Candidatus Kapabacteria bacterium]